MSSIIKAIENYIPGILSASERKYDQTKFVNSMVCMFAEDPNKLKCLETTTGKASLLNALKRAATTGLSLNPQSGKAGIIVYYNKKQQAHIASYQIFKNGMIDMAMQTGKIKFITCDTVMENDHFKVTKTIEGDKFEFEPELDNRGMIRGFFAAMVTVDGVSTVAYMSNRQVQAHRDAYAASSLSWDDGNPKVDAAWNKSYEGMGLKTVMKRMLRNSYVEAESEHEEYLRSAIREDDESESELMEDLTVSKPDHKGANPSDIAGAIASKTPITVDAEVIPKEEKPAEKKPEAPKKPEQKKLPANSPFK